MQMALPRTIIRSGALRAVAYCGGFVLEVRRIFDVGALLTIIGTFTLAGCYPEPHYRPGHGQ